MDDEHEFGLVMPFVVVVSNGGPYDDEAYCAGYEAGKLDQLLEQGARGVSQIARTANVPQLDLIAMHHGLTFSSIECPESEGEWSDIHIGEFDG